MCSAFLSTYYYRSLQRNQGWYCEDLRPPWAKMVLAARGEKVLSLAEELHSEGYEAVGVQTDVSDEASVERLVQTAVSTCGAGTQVVIDGGSTLPETSSMGR